MVLLLLSRLTTKVTVVFAEKYNLFPATVGSILLKKRRSKLGSAKASIQSEKNFQSFRKTTELNQKVVELVEKYNIKGILLSGVHVGEAAEDIASKSGVDDFLVSPGCYLFFVK